jgi:hypothetical protein
MDLVVFIVTKSVSYQICFVEIVCVGGRVISKKKLWIC